MTFQIPRMYLIRGNSMSGSFWGRQTKKDKVAIIILALELIISLVLVLIGIGVFGDETKLSLGDRFAILAANIVALVFLLQFTISRSFDDQKDQIDRLSEEIGAVNSSISEALEETRSITVLGETYVKIFRQKKEVKDQYQNTLDSFLQRLSNCIDDKRSGALDIMDYYEVLKNLASSIERDNTGSNYKGEIWALTFLLDDEWDDTSSHEANWFAHLKKLDNSGIPTRRLWAFDKKMIDLIKKEPIGEDGIELLKRLSMYCSNETDYKNTSSYALAKEEILDGHVKLFGKGFFATALSNGELSLIRGVCFDNLLSSNSLGGEIDFDKNRIKKIKYEWQRYHELAIPLNDYLRKHGSKSAHTVMKKFDFSGSPEIPSIS